MSYAYWAPDKPLGSAACVKVMTKNWDYAWTNNVCELLKAFICEI